MPFYDDKNLVPEQMTVIRKKVEKEDFAKMLRANKPLPELIFGKMLRVAVFRESQCGKFYWQMADEVGK